jgi:alpha-mannosidase
VTLANSDCLFMKAGASTLAALDVSTPQISVLAGGQIDGPKLGIPGQGGDRYFLQRFALRTHGAYDQAGAMRFGLEHQNPLLTGLVTGASPSYNEKSLSALAISDPNVLLWALKPAEDGIDNAGVALRVWNMSGAESSFTVRMPGWKIASAKRATHIETPIADARVSDGTLQGSAPGYAIETYLLKLEPVP